MAAECKVQVVASLTGLGKTYEFNETFSVTTTPSAKAYIYQVQATTDVAEALQKGDVTTPELIIIHAVDNEVEVDTDWVTPTFEAHEIIAEGEVRVIKPAGVVYIKNHTTSEVATVEALIVGT